MKKSEKTLKKPTATFYGVRIFLYMGLMCLICTVLLQCMTTAGALNLSTQISVKDMQIPAWDVSNGINQQDVDVLEQGSREDQERQIMEILTSLPLNQQERSEWKVLRMRVTAYCTCPRCCGKYSDGKTATLHKIKPGDVFVAADKKIAFGTEMIIPGYNQDRPVEVLDRGRLIKGNRLDVFFNDHKKAYKWGTRYLDVLVRQEQ